MAGHVEESWEDGESWTELMNEGESKMSNGGEA